MDTNFLGCIREFAQRKAVVLREEALAWDILARAIQRERRRIEEEAKNKPPRPKMPPPEERPVLEDRLYVRIKEASQIMGICKTALYNEIKAGRLKVKKAGKRTIIAVDDIHAWFDALPER